MANAPEANLPITVRETTLNRVVLEVDLKGNRGARIYRRQGKRGRFEEVGVATEDTFTDTAALEPGKSYSYQAVPWRSPYFYPELDQLAHATPAVATIPTPPRSKAVAVTGGDEPFTVTLAGYLDETNTVTRGPEIYCPGPGGSMPPYEQVFEPNLYVAIENLGDSDVVDPWLVANGQRDWWSVERVAQEIARGRRLTEEERMMALWQFACDQVYDSRTGLAWYDDMADPVKLLNVYGFDGCVAQAVATRRLAEAMGVNARVVWLAGAVDGHGRGRGCAHAIFEAEADAAWHLLDTDQALFFLNRDNRTAASAQELAQDLDLIRRTHRNLGLAGRDMAERSYYEDVLRDGRLIYPASKGGQWTDNAGASLHRPGHYPPPHTMALTLRPGEKLVRYWDHVGKLVVRGRRLHPAVRVSNGKLVYRPRLRDPLALKGAVRSKGIVQEQSRRRPALHPARCRQTAEVVWRVQSPYAIAGASVGLTCRRKTQHDGLELLFSKDGRDWRSLWVAAGHRLDACIDLDWHVNPALHDWREEKDLTWHTKPCYEYYVKLAMWAGSQPHAVGLDAIRFDTDVQCATHSLPSLMRGRNALVYRDATPGPRRVRITYGWQEDHERRPPGRPRPVHPSPGAHVPGLDFEFRWCEPKGRGARLDDYHVQVSRYPDFRWCVCPTFDRYVGRTRYAGQRRWQPQFPNLLSPDETYYWRVRARSSQGVWGEWSEVRSFVPHGPRRPVGLRVVGEGQHRALTWRPHPQGNRPVRYRVYRSQQPGGFSVSENSLLGEVTATQWAVPRGEGKPGAWYRVVAMDANGVASTPSECVDT